MNQKTKEGVQIGVLALNSIVMSSLITLLVVSKDIDCQSKEKTEVNDSIKARQLEKGYQRKEREAYFQEYGLH